MSVTLSVGGTQQLSYQLLGPLYGIGTPLWSSSNPSVATVNSVGTVTAVSLGTTTITASLNGVSGTTVVTVGVPAPSNPVLTFGATVALSIQNNFPNYSTRIHSVFAMDGGVSADGSNVGISWTSVLGYGGAVAFAPSGGGPLLVKPDVNDKTTWYWDTSNGGAWLLNPATGFDYHGTGGALIVNAVFNDPAGGSLISVDDGASGIMSFLGNPFVSSIIYSNSMGAKIDTQHVVVRERYPSSRMKVGMVSRSARRFSVEYPPIPALKSSSLRLPASTGARVWFGFDPAGGHRNVQGNCLILMQSEWTATEKAILMGIMAHHCGAHADDATRLAEGGGDSITSSFFATARTWFPQMMDMARYAKFGDVDTAVPTATYDIARLPEGDGLFFEELDSVPERARRFVGLRIAGRRNIVFLMGPTNDVALYGDDGPTSWGNFTAECQARRLAGDYVIAIGMLPRSEAGDQTFFDAARDYHKSQIAAGVGVYYDDYVDTFNDVKWGPNGNIATLQGLGLVDGGGIHPTTPGHLDIATRLTAPALDRAIVALGLTI